MVEVVGGLLVAALGGGITAATYFLAPWTGGLYVVTWGIILVGAFLFLRGLVKMLAGVFSR